MIVLYDSMDIWSSNKRWKIRQNTAGKISLLLDILRSMSSCSTCVKVLSGGTGRVYKQRRAEGIRKRRMLETQPYQITLDISLSLFPTYIHTLRSSVKHLHTQRMDCNLYLNPRKSMCVCVCLFVCVSVQFFNPLPIVQFQIQA